MNRLIVALASIGSIGAALTPNVSYIYSKFHQLVNSASSLPQAAELSAHLLAKGIKVSPDMIVNLVREKASSRRAKMQDEIRSGTMENPSVNTIYGSLTGLKFNNSVQFLGVPFATPPVGNMRW